MSTHPTWNKSRDYAAVYRKLHPRQFPYSPWERQLELRDLWEADQEEFKRFVDAVFDFPHP